MNIDKSKVKWRKGYKEIVVCETNDSIWSYEDKEAEFEVSNDNELSIYRVGNDGAWVYITREMLPILKEAIIQMENETEKSL